MIPPPDAPMCGMAFLYHLLDHVEAPKDLARLDKESYIYSGIGIPLQEFDSFCDMVELFLPQKFAGRSHLRHGDVVQVEPDDFESTCFLLVDLQEDAALIDGAGGVDLLPTHGSLYYMRLPEGFSIKDKKSGSGNGK